LGFEPQRRGDAEGRGKREEGERGKGGRSLRGYLLGANYEKALISWEVGAFMLKNFLQSFLDD
jgi:hypothetical protein